MKKKPQKSRDKSLSLHHSLPTSPLKKEIFGLDNQLRAFESLKTSGK